MANFELAIQKTLENEGLLSNDLSDKGGITKFGISKTSYPDEDIPNLTLDRAKYLYKKDYWNPILGDQISSQEVAETLFDFAVNSGVGTSVKLAQRVIKVDDDGKMGTNTLKALNNFEPSSFIDKFTIAKIKRYRDICLKNSDQKKFFFGWINRALKEL